MSNNEIDEVDQEGDLIMILLYRHQEHTFNGKPDWKHAKNGMYRGNLYDVVKNIDDSEFPFNNELDDYGNFMDTLEFFDQLDMFGRYRKGDKISLTEKGMTVGEKLEDNLTEDQNKAIKEAVGNYGK